MIIKKVGEYRLLSELSTRTTISICHLRKGTILHIKQIDERGHQVIGPPLLDWHHWDIDAVPVATNPLADLNMTDELWAKFKSRFVIDESVNPDTGQPIPCECGNGEPISTHHVPIAIERGEVQWSQGLFTCLACSMRLTFNVKKKAMFEVAARALAIAGGKN